MALHVGDIEETETEVIFRKFEEGWIGIGRSVRKQWPQFLQKIIQKLTKIIQKLTKVIQRGPMYPHSVSSNNYNLCNYSAIAKEGNRS